MHTVVPHVLSRISEAISALARFEDQLLSALVDLSDRDQLRWDDGGQVAPIVAVVTDYGFVRWAVAKLPDPTVMGARVVFVQSTEIGGDQTRERRLTVPFAALAADVTRTLEQETSASGAGVRYSPAGVG